MPSGLERQAGIKLPDAIVKLGYATNDQVMSAIAEAIKKRGLGLIGLSDAAQADLAMGYGRQHDVV